MNLYGGADKAIKASNREILKLFGRLKLAKWDEISVVRLVTEVYDQSVKTTKQRIYETAFDAYVVAMLEMKKPQREALGMAKEDINLDWVLAMLEEVDPVTMYAFMTETDRKKQRLIEALSVSPNRDEEIDRAMRYWAMQVGQYIDNSVYMARNEAFSRAGVEFVRWVTQEDERVCDDCDELDGQIFAIEEVPPPQHWRCRCYLRAYPEQR